MFTAECRQVEIQIHDRCSFFGVVTFQLKNYFQPTQNSEGPKNV